MSKPDRFEVPSATLETPHRAEFEVHKSRFIAWISRCAAPDEAQRLLQQARRAHPDARHHCLAFVAGPPGEQVAIGFSDDGEPGGTAGRPMYQVLEGSGLGQVGCVVIRYFGGIKLGTGGLARAYSRAVQLGLEALPTATFVTREPLRLLVDFSDEHAARQWCEARGALVAAVEYRADGALLQLDWPSSEPTDLDALSLLLRVPPQRITA